jgi:hypothetical protein
MRRRHDTRQPVEYRLKSIEIPDPSALAIWSTLAKIFREESHHLKEQSPRCVGVVIGRHNLPLLVTVALLMAERIRDELQCSGKLAPSHILNEAEAVAGLRVALIAKPRPPAVPVIEAKPIFAATGRAWPMLFGG